MNKLKDCRIEKRFCRACGLQMRVEICNGGFSKYNGEKIYLLEYVCPKYKEINLVCGKLHDRFCDIFIELIKNSDGSYSKNVIEGV